MNKSNIYFVSTLLLTLIVLIPTLRNGWTNLDDPIYLLENPLIKSLSWFNIKNMFTTLQVNGSYNPIVLLSWAFDYDISELKPFTFHLTNLLLHLLVVALVYYLALLLSKNKLVAFLTSLLFGIHPMHVEVVAWVTARKDLLYSIFYFAGLISYIFYLKKQTKHKWIYLYLCFILFTLSLLSKGSAVTFPIILFGFDYLYKRKGIINIIIEKTPFLILSIGFTYLSIIAQKAGGALQHREFYSTLDSLAVGFYGYLNYLVKLFFPFNLSALHPYPTNSGIPNPWYFYFSSIPVIGIVIYSLLKLNKDRILVFSLGFYYITLIPVIQVLPFGVSVVAERFSYLPYFGLFYLISNKVSTLLNNDNSKLVSSIKILLVCFFCFLAVKSFLQSKIWKNSETLWTNVINYYPKYHISYLNRSEYYINNNKFIEAKRDCDSIIKLKPDFYLGYYNRAYANQLENNYEESIKDYTKAIELNGDSYVTFQNRGILHSKLKNHNKAFEDFNKSIELQPANFLAYFNRGFFYKNNNKYQLAIKDFSKSISLNKNFYRAYYTRGVCYNNIQKNDSAITDFSRVISLKNNHFQAHLNRSKAYINAKLFAEALNDLNKALKIDETNIESYILKGIIYTEQNKYDNALYNFHKAEQKNSEISSLYFYRADVYLKLKKYNEALIDIKRCLKIEPNNNLAIKKRKLILNIIRSIENN